MMNPERWRQIRNIFDGALEHAPDERSRFLDEVCANDQEVRREVESLLSSLGNAESFPTTWAGSFSPDGDKIVFAGFRNGVWNLYWVSRSTKQQKQLTNYTKLNSYVRYPTWSPLKNQIAFEYAVTTGNIWIADLK